jgi:hypothetical protein
LECGASRRFGIFLRFLGIRGRYAVVSEVGPDKVVCDVLRESHGDATPVAAHLLTVLQQNRLEHALAGSFAAALYGARCVWPDHQVYLSPAAWKSFQQAPNTGFDSIDEGAIRFVADKIYWKLASFRRYVRVALAAKVTNWSVPLLGVRALRLNYLISSLLRPDEFSTRLAMVVELIRARRLDESFLPRLPADRHESFLRCLAEVRREDEYTEREEAE